MPSYLQCSGHCRDWVKESSILVNFFVTGLLINADYAAIGDQEE